MKTSLERTWEGVDRNSDRGLAWVLAGTLLAWFLVVLGAGASGLFLADASRPPVALVAAIAGPPVLFGLLYRSSPRFRAFALGIDLRLLTAMQGWRVIGIMFLALYAFGLLPGLFAWPAGLGDMVVGLAAPFVLRPIMAGAPGWRRQVVWLNVAGLVDFAGAIGTGVLTSNTALGFLASDAPRASMGLLPLSLVPTFAVPFWVILHAISVLQIWRAGAGPRAGA